MPPRRGERGLVGATRWIRLAQLLDERLLAGLDDLGCTLRELLSPLQPRYAGLGGLGGLGVAASTETPDRPAPQAVPPPAAGHSPDLGDPDSDDPAIVAILSRAQAGDAEAFGELYDRYADLIYRYAYYRVGHRALAEDLTSETFTRALRRITSFSWQGRDFGAWLITIARNLIADHYKSARFRMELSTADLLGVGADRPAAGPEGQVLDSLTNAALLDAVRQLGAEQQECVVLRFFEGLSVTETALAMGKKPGAVKALQYRAVRTLGRLLPVGLER